ncbi:MMPL family transporter [Streptomyces sp. NPDC003077]|uniref:MMPL family transporter n=1 Tax=Streptomyces sp. NPDC003077 TaxID=3154443 RepID=UPI0033B883F2
MASRLYAWARWVVRRRGLVIGVWLLLLAVIGGLGITLHGKPTTEYSVPGIESQQAQDLLKERFPQASGGVARVVFAAPKGDTLTDPKAQRVIAAGLKEAAGTEGVVNVSDPLKTGTVSRDRTIGYADVSFKQGASDVPQSAKDALSRAMDPARDAGFQVEFGGSVMTPEIEVGGPAEIVGVVVAFVVLALALGSLVAAGLPLITAAVGVAIGVLGAQFVSRFMEMTGTATALALMIGLAVGIDYALFIIARHREQLADPDADVNDSIARAVATAGSAVVFAGATVIIALAALSATGIPFLTIMGLAAAVTVLLAVLVAISLVPAVLSLFGERLRPRPRRRSRPGRAERAPGAWGMAWGRAVTRAPVVVLLVGVLGLLALALPARDLRLGLPGNAAQPTDTTQHKSYDLLSQGFGPGFNATLTAIVDTDGIPAERRAQTVKELGAALSHDRGVAAVAPPIANPEGTLAVIGVVPTTGPDDQATTDLVHRLREHAPDVDRAGGTLYVAGATAAAIDVSAKLSDALPLFVAIIVILALVLLALAFRSLLVPLKAVLGFLLSIAAALGATTWVFQDGHLADALQVPAAGPVVAFLPVLLIGVLFGLAMDYEVFLVSRMREHYEHTGDAAGAITHGVASSGRVVCAAALIMAAVFGGFIFNPDPILKSIGFALAIGVAIDAFVVRMTLVPAALALLGRRAWALPRWLDRAIPHIDIEGARLPQAAPAGRGEEQGQGQKVVAAR